MDPERLKRLCAVLAAAAFGATFAVMLWALGKAFPFRLCLFLMAQLFSGGAIGILLRVGKRWNRRTALGDGLIGTFCEMALLVYLLSRVKEQGMVELVQGNPLELGMGAAAISVSFILLLHLQPRREDFRQVDFRESIPADLGERLPPPEKGCRVCENGRVLDFRRCPNPECGKVFCLDCWRKNHWRCLDPDCGILAKGYRLSTR